MQTVNDIRHRATRDLEQRIFECSIFRRQHMKDLASTLAREHATGMSPEKLLVLARHDTWLKNSRGGSSYSQYPGVKTERIAEELETALDRGVIVETLLHPAVVETLPETVGQRYRTYLQDERAFQVRTSAEVYSTFTLVDHSEVCIEVPHPLNPQKAFALINLKDSEFAASAEREFEPHWDRAEELLL